MALGSANGHEDNCFQALAAALDEGRDPGSGWRPRVNSQPRSRELPAWERRGRDPLWLRWGGVEFVHILKFAFLFPCSLLLFFIRRRTRMTQRDFIVPFCRRAPSAAGA